MKIYNQSVEEITFKYGNRFTLLAEYAGRVCTGTVDKMKEGGDIPFVGNLIKKGHTSVLEHTPIYMVAPLGDDRVVNTYMDNAYSRVFIKDDKAYISTNMRVFESNGSIGKDWVVEMPTDNHVLRRTFEIVTDRRIETELVRHRTGSFSIESTRYINYHKKGMGFININKYMNHWFSMVLMGFMRRVTSMVYSLMVNVFNERREIARSVLLSNNKATIIMTAFEDDWDAFLDLRWRGKYGRPHPQIFDIAQSISVLLSSKPIMS